MRTLFCWLGLTVFSVSVGAEPAKRLAPPDEAAEKVATNLVSDLYKADYAAAKTPEQKVALSKKLLADAAGTADDKSAQYVLYRISRDIAAQQGELSLAFEAIDHMARICEVDSLQLKSEAVTIVGKASRRAPPRADTLAALNTLIDEAVTLDRYDMAKKFVGVAAGQARQAKDLDQVKRLTARTKEIEDIEKQFASVEDALKLLQTKPTDPAANQTVGWFRCSVKGDWTNGALMLALGNDASLKSLAKAEISGNPNALELGDGWWKVSETQEGLPKSRVQAHAVAWYRKAMPMGVTKARVLKRIGERYGTLSVPRVPTGLYREGVDCKTTAHEVAMGEKFDISKNWLVSVEARAPAVDPGFQVIVMWGDDRGGMDAICLMLEGKALWGSSDDCQTNTRTAVTSELPPGAEGKWTKMTFVYRAEENVLQLYVSDTLVADSVAPFKPNIDRAMPVRIGGAGGDGQRFRGELRNLVFTNY
jgi:hypothetical protein